MYSRISGAKDGRGSIRYAEGSVKNNGKERNIFIDPINMIPDGKYANQMEPLWQLARRNHKIQTRRIVVSFSKKELDPQSSEDINTARDIIREFVNTYYPDRQAACYYQRDGRSGCLHCHIIVNDISMTDHKGCTREQQHYKYVRKGIDKTATKYITIDHGETSQSKQSRTERIKSERAQKIMKDLPSLKGDNLRRILIEEKAYSYKEDLKQRIHNAMIGSCNEQDFIKKLMGTGIDVIKKTSSKYGLHYVYDFVGCPIGVKNRKARSYKLGYSYGPNAAKVIWNINNKKKQKENDNQFSKWMQDKGKECFEFDENGKLIRADFDLLNELREQFENEQIQPETHNDRYEAACVFQKKYATEIEQSEKHPVIKKATCKPPSRNSISSQDIVKSDLTSIKQLIGITNEILRRLADEQAKCQSDDCRYSEAVSALNTPQKGVRNYDKQY